LYSLSFILHIDCDPWVRRDPPGAYRGPYDRISDHPKEPIDRAPDRPHLGDPFSFKSCIPPAQARVLNLTFAAIGLALVMVPMAALYMLCAILFVLFSSLIVWRALLVLVSLFARHLLDPELHARQQGEALPTYSVLGPCLS
jgi:hypothetical protein